MGWQPAPCCPYPWPPPSLTCDNPNPPILAQNPHRPPIHCLSPTLPAFLFWLHHHFPVPLRQAAASCVGQPKGCSRSTQLGRGEGFMQAWVSCKALKSSMHGHAPTQTPDGAAVLHLSFSTSTFFSAAELKIPVALCFYRRHFFLKGFLLTDVFRMCFKEVFIHLYIVGNPGSVLPCRSYFWIPRV